METWRHGGSAAPSALLFSASCLLGSSSDLNSVVNTRRSTCGGCEKNVSSFITTGARNVLGSLCHSESPSSTLRDSEHSTDGVTVLCWFSLP
ncbi:uncharacterized [Tachysurus ichikawai]